MMLVIAQAGSVAEPCGPTEKSTALCEWLLQHTHNQFLARMSDVLVVRPAKILVILLVAVLVTAFTHRAINRFSRSMRGEPVRRRLSALREMTPDVVTPPPSPRAAQRAAAVGALLRSTTTLLIWTIAFVMMLGQLGVAVGPLIAGAGVVGIGVGFGSQNLIRDLISGVFMLIEDQYGVGDVIDAGPASGVVEGISLRTTRVRDVEGTLWHVPNGSIERVGNMSQQWSRALLDIDVSYATELVEARRLIKEVADGLWQDEAWAAKVLAEPEVWGVEGLGADGVSIRLVVKTAPLARWEVARELRARIKTAFDEHGVEIPFPQRVVWHREAPDGKRQAS